MWYVNGSIGPVSGTKASSEYKSAVSGWISMSRITHKSDEYDMTSYRFVDIVVTSIAVDSGVVAYFVCCACYRKHTISNTCS